MRCAKEGSVSEQSIYGSAGQCVVLGWSGAVRRGQAPSGWSDIPGTPSHGGASARARALWCTSRRSAWTSGAFTYGTGARQAQLRRRVVLNEQACNLFAEQAMPLRMPTRAVKISSLRFRLFAKMARTYMCPQHGGQLRGAASCDLCKQACLAV